MTTNFYFDDKRVLIVSFEGWSDASEAASSALRYLGESFEATKVAEISDQEYFDFQYHRPIVRIAENGTRELVWPQLSLFQAKDQSEALLEAEFDELAFASTAESGFPISDLLFMVGPEPSRLWQSFAEDFLELVALHQIDCVIFLGALLADVPHTRPVSIHTTSDNVELQKEFGLKRSDYEGPTGISTVLSTFLESQGVPSLSIWASVPHYAHVSPSPTVSLALLQKIASLISIEVDTAELTQQSSVWIEELNQLVQDDDDLARYISQLETARDTVEAPEASGEVIAEQFEKYLKLQNDRESSSGED